MEVVGGFVKRARRQLAELVQRRGRNAVRIASRSIRHITGVDVVSSTAEVDANGVLVNYEAHCKIAFVVEASIKEAGDVGGAVAASSSGAAGGRGVFTGPRLRRSDSDARRSGRGRDSGSTWRGRAGPPGT